MKDNQVEDDMRTLAEAQRIITDKARSNKPDSNDVRILADARRIQEDEGRSDAVRKHMRDKKKDSPKADVFAGEGSFAGKLKARREALDAGDPEGAREVFLK